MIEANIRIDLGTSENRRAMRQLLDALDEVPEGRRVAGHSGCSATPVAEPQDREGAGLRSPGARIPSEPKVSTPHGADAPGTGVESGPAGALVVGEQPRGMAASPADAPEEAEGASAPDAAAGESPALNQDRAPGPLTPRQKRKIWDLAELGHQPLAIADATGLDRRQIKKFVWAVRNKSMQVPPDIDWDALVNRVLAGKGRTDEVAREAGAGRDRLRKLVAAARAERKAGRQEAEAADGGAAGLPAAEPDNAASEGGDHVDDTAIDSGAPAEANVPVPAEAEAAPPDDFDTVEPWTEKHDIAMLRAAMGESDVDAVAEVIGRFPEEVERRLEELAPEPRNRTTIGAVLKQLTGATEPDWINLCGLVEAGRPIEKVAADGGVTVQALQLRLDRRHLQRDKEAAAAREAASTWTPERDLLLVEETCAGLKAGVPGIDRAAKALGIPRDEALARFHSLLPRKGLNEQNALLKRLRMAAAGRLQAAE